MIDQATVVVRSVGERTSAICRKLLEEIFPAKNIYVIHVTPFSEAIREAFRIGLAHHLPWTLCIDADVLVTPENITKLIERSHQLETNVFEIQGLVLDKFFGAKRPAGNHLYRTDLLSKALALIPEEGTSLRPESDMLNAMSALGFPWVQQDVLVGIHDFEQYYSDIYRKSFLQAHKHQWILPDIERFWKGMCVDDQDYEVALWGLRSGKIYADTVWIDKNFLHQEANDVLSIKGILEKPEVDRPYTHDLIQEKVSLFESNAEYDILQEKIFPPTLWNRVVTSNNKDIASAWHHELLFRVGSKVEALGKKIKNLSKPV